VRVLSLSLLWELEFNKARRQKVFNCAKHDFMQLAIQKANHVTVLLSLTLNLAEIGEPLFNCTRFAKKRAAVVQLHTFR
jgi:hypothetical protein